MKIDWWTLAIQTVNVAILVWLLGRYFWQPVACMIEERRAAAQRTLADAKAKEDAAAAALTNIAATRAGFAKERDAILAAAQEEADKNKTRLLEDARREAASLEAAAKAAIASERQAASKRWTEQASGLAVDISRRLIARLTGGAADAAFLDALLQQINGLPASEKHAAGEGPPLELVSAAPIEPAEQERYRASIAKAFGASPQITFKADAGLIAGLEIRAPHFLVSNSWRSDLARILSDLGRDA